MIFHGNAVELWPSLIKGCIGGYSKTKVDTNNNFRPRVTKFLRDNAKLSIVREHGKTAGIRLYNLSDYLIEKGVKNGSVVVEICNEPVKDYLSSEVSCKNDIQDFVVKNESGELVKIDVQTGN